MMLARAGQLSFTLMCTVLGASLLTGCGSFPLKYQNYFTKNFAYYASEYEGNPQDNLSSGAESNNFVDGNEPSYSAAKVPQVIAGFRSLEYQNNRYSKVGMFDIQFTAQMVPPGKTEAESVQLATFDLNGKEFASKAHVPELSKIVLIKMSYPAPMLYLDSKALQAKYGSGDYTVIWKVASEDGKASNRELARVTTSLVP